MRRAGVAAALLLAGCAPAAGREVPDVRTVALTVRHSRFSPAEITVQAGTTVRFVVRNTDPIDHELIVGDAAVQERHERGTEAHHGNRPGEVSVPAGSRAETTYTFRRSGTLLLGCHLPGHYAYGMRGAVRVTP